MARLQEKYKTEIAAELQKKLKLENPMEVPKITKITLNMGVGEAIADRKVMEKAASDMEKIAGQKPVIRKARKSVAAFEMCPKMDIERVARRRFQRQEAGQIISRTGTTL